MKLIEQIKADREAGTQGAWINEVIYGWSDTPCIKVAGEQKPFANFIRPKRYYTEYVTDADGSTILSESSARAAGNYVPTRETRKHVVEEQDADARRIARVPVLEEIALAAAYVSRAFKAFDEIGCQQSVAELCEAQSMLSKALEAHNG